MEQEFYWKVHLGVIYKVNEKHRREQAKWAHKGFKDYASYFDTEQEAIAFQLGEIEKDIKRIGKNLSLAQMRLKRFKKKYSITD